MINNDIYIVGWKFLKDVDMLRLYRAVKVWEKEGMVIGSGMGKSVDDGMCLGVDSCDECPAGKIKVMGFSGGEVYKFCQCIRGQLDMDYQPDKNEINERNFQISIDEALELVDHELEQRSVVK